MRCTFLLLSVCGGAALAAPVPIAPAPTPKPGRTPIGPEYEPTTFKGRVESFSNEKITIKPEGYLRIDLTWLDADGVRQERYYEQDNSRQTTKTYTFSDRMLQHNGVLLPPGRRGHQPPNRCEYLIADVRVGDLVHVSYGTLRGELLCTSLTIMRRPGGRVPDACGDDDPAYKMKVSTERNAAQFAEDTLSLACGRTTAGQWLAGTLVPAVRESETFRRR